MFFRNFFKAFKVHIFGPIFSLSVLNTITTLKRYCKATLNVFLNR